MRNVHRVPFLSDKAIIPHGGASRSLSTTLSVRPDARANSSVSQTDACRPTAAWPTVDIEAKLHAAVIAAPRIALPDDRGSFRIVMVGWQGPG
jgi:hypothetical protein